MQPALERFESKVEAIPWSGCWIWMGGTDKDGYGRFWIGEQSIRANRASWILYKGDPGSSLVCHSCDIEPCVNPAHLFLGTHQDNHDDALKKNRLKCGTYQALRTHCEHGHPFDEDNTYFRKNENARACRICRKERRKPKSERRW